VNDQRPHFIVDAWPVMEWVQSRQPVADRFASIIQEATVGEIKLSMSRINHGEVIYLVRKNFSEALARTFLRKFRNLPIELLSVSDQLIDAAVELKSSLPISFADAFAAAQAMELSLPLITGDRDFLVVEGATALKLHWLGA
jgi:predicted nucleic acid-binding protein